MAGLMEKILREWLSKTERDVVPRDTNASASCAGATTGGEKEIGHCSFASWRMTRLGGQRLDKSQNALMTKRALMRNRSRRSGFGDW